jgi:hypothetical protein
MNRFKLLVVAVLLLATAAVAFGRLWYKQDIQWGTGSSATSDGLPLNAVNASVIPLSTGSNVEAAITSLQAQITALTAQLALKAPIASPAFTGTPVLPSGTTIGDVTAEEIARLSGVTSALQAQINAKAANVNAVITGSLTVSGEITGLQVNTSGGDNTHFAHLGNTGDITVPASDNAGILWYNATLEKWRVTVAAGSIDNLAVEP